jgi:hypothetical protein
MADATARAIAATCPELTAAPASAAAQLPWVRESTSSSRALSTLPLDGLGRL